MKYCTKCGNELFDEAVICPKCGCPVPNEKAHQRGSKGKKILGIIITVFSGMIASLEGLSLLGYATNGRFPTSSLVCLLVSLAFLLVGILLIKGIKLGDFFKKKKTIAIIGVFIIAITAATTILTNLSSNNSSYDIADELKVKVWADVTIECKYSYADVKLVQTDITSVSENNGIYTIKRKVTITDNYGDKYVGKIDGEYEYYETSETFHKISLEIEQPKKER